MNSDTIRNAPDARLPAGYVSLPGSELPGSAKTRHLGPADDAETLRITIVLRRRTDGPPLPDASYYTKVPRGRRKRLSTEEFASRYGAHADDIGKVVRFAEGAGLKVVETHAARRTVVAEGTVARINKAFAVSLGRYLQTIVRYHGVTPDNQDENFRGREGFVHVPGDLAEIIVSVMGLDNRTVVSRNMGGPADPPNWFAVTVPQLTQVYNFPTDPPAGQTYLAGGQNIGILSPTAGAGGYFPEDITATFAAAPYTPVVTAVSGDGTTVNGSFTAVTNAASTVNASNQTVVYFAPNFVPADASLPVGSYFFVVGQIPLVKIVASDSSSVTLNQTLPTIQPGTTVYFNADSETTQDICIAGLAAPGANIYVYFSGGDAASILAMLHTAIFPAGNTPPPCSVLSTSFAMSLGDDLATLNTSFGFLGGMAVSDLESLSAAYADAAIQFITVCAACGDKGSGDGVGDGKAHVQYPASDPGVLSVGGTSIGSNSPTGLAGISVAQYSDIVEYAWNDSSGATGGGVSDYFPLPAWQNHNGDNVVPKSVNDGQVRRGVPDVAALGTAKGGYLTTAGAGYFSLAEGKLDFIANGTSGAAPLWAGLIAVINAALGENVGFINPSIYQIGPSAFNQIVTAPPAPTDNATEGVPGYPVNSPRWSANIGWGSPNGAALLAALQTLPSVYITGGYQSPDIILTNNNPQNGPVGPVPLGGTMPSGPWDTLLQPNSPYALSAVVHNDSDTDAVGVQVSFWAIPGGVGTNGTPVGVPQTVTVPAFSNVTVNASANFMSAPMGEHLCAVVSLYWNNATTGCNTDATTALEIPDPGWLPDSRKCSAWRNTDSMGIMQMRRGFPLPFKFAVGTGKLPAGQKDPIGLLVVPFHVPADKVQAITLGKSKKKRNRAGGEADAPSDLLPAAVGAFPAIDLKTKVAAKTGGRIKELGAGKWILSPEGDEAAASFEIAGEIPATAKAGDMVLVKVTARYPDIGRRAARDVEYLQVIHVLASSRSG